MATHSSIPAWRIPWTEERETEIVGHDRETNTSKRFHINKAL